MKCRRAFRLGLTEPSALGRIYTQFILLTVYIRLPINQDLLKGQFSFTSVSLGNDTVPGTLKESGGYLALVVSSTLWDLNNMNANYL